MSDNIPVVKETTQETNTQVESKPERPEADIKKVLKPEVLNI